MNEDKIREAFEQNPRYDFEKDANGYYVHAIVADAFVNFRDGYQAAAKSAWQPPIPPAPEVKP